MTQDNSIVIREYLTTDKEVVMNLIKLNTPNFFAKEEVNDLSNYLDKGIELYYVLLVDGKVVGCGGINFAEKRTIGKISWDLMHPDYQGKSLGKKLLRYRIEVLKAIPSIKKITVRTSQLASPPFTGSIPYSLSGWCGKRSGWIRIWIRWKPSRNGLRYSAMFSIFSLWYWATPWILRKWVKRSAALFPCC